MTKTFKPMLGYNKPYVIEDLRFPLYASPKLDGLRCISKDGEALSRSLTRFPNSLLQDHFEGADGKYPAMLQGLDGELIVDSPTGEGVLERTKALMSFDKTPDFTFRVFDIWNDRLRLFKDRLAILKARSLDWPRWVILHEQVLIHSLEELVAYEEEVVEAGYEGVCLRYPDTLYKYGRSTFNEGALLKLKRFVDFEAKILAIHEAMYNDNAVQRSNAGATKRSSAKAGRTEGKGWVGRLDCQRLSDDVEFGVGSFRIPQKDKEYMLNHPEEFIGKIAKIKAMKYGEVDKPRHGVYLGLRDPIDMSED